MRAAGDAVCLAGHHLGETVDPIRDAPGARCWRPAASAPALPRLVGQGDGFPRRIVRQAEHDQVHLAPSCRGARRGPCGARRAGCDVDIGLRGRRSRMPRPVVPDSPSMKTRRLRHVCAPSDGVDGPQAGQRKARGTQSKGGGPDGPAPRNQRRQCPSALAELEAAAGLGSLPYFLRSTTRESRVRKPATFRMPRRSGS